ncbi:MAG: family 16 glycoside hydrolase [Planctomycetota bacterium]
MRSNIRTGLNLAEIGLIIAVFLLSAHVFGAEEAGADNTLCFVCHGSLRSEEIVTNHGKEGVTCMNCHGESMNHMQDEMLMTKPDVLFGRTEIEGFCKDCHEVEKVHSNKAKVDEFRRKWRGRIRPNGRAVTPESVCTDCHGTHNIVRQKPGKSETQGWQSRWESAFNGRDISGWHQLGDAKWTVRNGRLYSRPGRKGGELLSDAVYGDYLLSVTFRANWPVRAGIWLRSDDGSEGIRVEILESKKPVAYTGSIRVSDKRLALVNYRPDLLDRQGWNTISVEVKEDRFAVWLNGEEIGAVRIDGAAKGRIGLHIEKERSNKNAELCVSEILVKRPGSRQLDDGFVPVFNGTDLSGWEVVGKAKWNVENGMLVGMQGPNREPGDLLTETSYEDFELKVVYRVEWPCNSGVWFRYQSPQKAYQADILEYKNPVCYSGTLYCTGKMFLAMNTDKALVDRDGWNTIVVRAEDDHLQMWLNDSKIADVRDRTSDSGRIGFQVHAGDAFKSMKIVVREVSIKPL